MTVQNSRDWRGRLFTFGPVFIWAAVIFVLGSEKGSMSETSILLRPILHFLFPTAPEDVLQIYHGYVRKAAHVTEYAILAILVFRAARQTGGALSSLRYVLPLATVLAVASTDEIRQSFEPSRTSSILDVGWDTLGGCIGTIVSYLWTRARG